MANSRRKKDVRTEVRSVAAGQHPFGVSASESDDDDRGGTFFPRVSPRRQRRQPRGKSHDSPSRNSRHSTGSSTINFPPLLSPSVSAGFAAERVPEMIKAYDRLIKDSVWRYAKLSSAIGADVFKQAELVEGVFETQREFLLSSCRHRSPSAVGTGPVQAFKIKDIKAFARRHDYSRNRPHLGFISDTIGCLGWVVVGSNPCVFIRESYENGKSHVKKIKEMQKEDGEREHSEWIKSWQDVILDLEAFVREFHRSGLVWGSA